MKKQIVTLLLALICCLTIEAKEPSKGYRGFVEWNMDYGTFDASQYRAHYMLYGISTSHGYQFNPHLFIGAGVWIQGGAGDVLHRLGWPIYIQGRTDWTFGKVPLYIDLRLGGTVFGRTIENGDDKLLIAPSVGYRIDWGKRVSANFGIGLSIHGSDDGGNYGGTHYTWHPLPSIRIGLEF